jgi:glycosyltransferase involved in cell wall biosynthesis
MTPFCSILIATYGDPAWEELAWSRAYPSTVGQGIEPFDGSVEVIVHHVQDGTLAQARNEAAARADGLFLAYVDADDELEPFYIEKMAKMARHYNLVRRGDLIDNPCLFAPAVRYWAGDGREPAAGIPNLGGWPRINEAVIATLMPRLMFLEHGGFREATDDGTPLSLYEDYDLTLRLFDAGACLVHVPEAVYRAHVRPGSRNVSGDPLRVYNAIWADHTSRIAAGSRL